MVSFVFITLLNIFAIEYDSYEVRSLFAIMPFINLAFLCIVTISIVRFLVKSELHILLKLLGIPLTMIFIYSFFILWAFVNIIYLP